MAGAVEQPVAVAHGGDVFDVELGDIRSGHAGLQAGDDVGLRLVAHFDQFLLFGGRLAEDHRAADAGGVAVHARAELQEGHIALLDGLVSRAADGLVGALAGQHPQRIRFALRAQLVHLAQRQTHDLLLGHADLDVGDDVVHGLMGDFGGGAHALKLVFGLAHADFVDDIVRLFDPDLAVYLQRVAQGFVYADGHQRKACHADAADGLVAQQLGEDGIEGIQLLAGILGLGRFAEGLQQADFLNLAAVGGIGEALRADEQQRVALGGNQHAGGFKGGPVGGEVADVLRLGFVTVAEDQVIALFLHGSLHLGGALLILVKRDGRQIQHVYFSFPNSQSAGF